MNKSSVYGNLRMMQSSNGCDHEENTVHDFTSLYLAILKDEKRE